MHFQCTTGRLLTINDLDDVYRLIHPARIQWDPVGLELGLHESDLENIKDEHDTNAKRLKRMLAKWLRRARLKPTWQKLINAFKSITVDREDTATNIQRFVDSRATESSEAQLEVN